MQPKTTYFPTLANLETKAGKVDLSTPKVMGIINATPDSFFSESRVARVEEAVQKAADMVSEGARMLDIGGMSSRPGADIIDPKVEATRVIPIVQAVAQAFPHIPVSIDTIHADVAEAAVEAGASIINDISAATWDRRMTAVAALTGAPVILMHMQGTPALMQNDPHYENVALEVREYLLRRCDALKTAGVEQLILDPGFGFGKTLEHNYQLAAGCRQLADTGMPLLVGVSRKSMVNKVLNISSNNALTGTIALHMYLLQQGASILRVHDVREAVETVAIFRATRAGQLHENVPLLSA